MLFFCCKVFFFFIFYDDDFKIWNWQKERHSLSCICVYVWKFYLRVCLSMYHFIKGIFHRLSVCLGFSSATKTESISPKRIQKLLRWNEICEFYSNFKRSFWIKKAFDEMIKKTIFFYTVFCLFFRIMNLQCFLLNHFSLTRY